MKFNTILRIIAGALFIALGIYMLLNPLATLVSVSIVLGAGIFALGVFYIILYAKDRDSYESPGWLLAQGIIDLIIGAYLLFHIGATTAVLPYVVAFWAIFIGVLRLIFALNLRRDGFGRWYFVLFTSIVALLLGILILFVPAFGAAYIVAMVAIFMVFYGVAIIGERAARRRRKD